MENQSVKINSLLHYINLLNDLYTENRYEDCKDCFSVELICPPVKSMKKELNDYFINRPWDTYENTWKHLNLVQQDFLHRSMEGFRRIEKIIINHKSRLLSFQFKFLCDLETLYKGYDLLIDDRLEDYEKAFPQLTEKNLAQEVDMLTLLLGHIKSLELTPEQ